MLVVRCCSHFWHGRAIDFVSGAAELCRPLQFYSCTAKMVNSTSRNKGRIYVSPTPADGPTDRPTDERTVEQHPEIENEREKNQFDDAFRFDRSGFGSQEKKIECCVCFRQIKR